MFAVLSLILMPLGMLALCATSAGTRGGRLTFAATVIMWLGAALALPYDDAEDFALHAIARGRFWSATRPACISEFNPLRDVPAEVALGSAVIFHSK